MRAFRTFALSALALGLSCAHLPPIEPYYAATEVCRPAADGRAAPAPGLIADGEDGGGQISLQGDRDGFVYLYADKASQMVRVPGETAPNTRPIAGGPPGSRCAYNLRGRLADDAPVFAGIGFNMRDPLQPYDARRYSGISFSARRAPDTAMRIAVKFPDWNTEPAGQCVDCFNHFQSEVLLTETWTRYTVSFASLEQLPDWGDPRPPRLDTSRLFGVRFEVKNAGRPFDIWIDDLAFVEGTSAASPSSQAAATPVTVAAAGLR